MLLAATLAALASTGCDSRHSSLSTRAATNPQDAFWNNLTALCGNAYAGTIATNEGAGTGPDPFAGKALVMHVRECTKTQIRVPFHVGDDRSRTWVFTRTASGLRLKHDHRHADGSEDKVTQYGGETIDAGSATQQRFPADEHSKQLFVREKMPQSVPNTWVVDIEPAQRYRYALTRPGREFRVDFDLSRPVAAPPPPWGG
ncbi:MAG TPA: hypothetical protein VJ724_13290 [Tahibacter sp.]|nr:hypothetical protein [Tahibacter sp.]